MSERFGLPPKSKIKCLREDLYYWYDDKWFRFRFWCSNHSRLFPLLLGFLIGLLGNWLTGVLGWKD